MSEDHGENNYQIDIDISKLQNIVLTTTFVDKNHEVLVAHIWHGTAHFWILDVDHKSNCFLAHHLEKSQLRLTVIVHILNTTAWVHLNNKLLWIFFNNIYFVVLKL